MEMALMGRRGDVLREYIGYIERVDREHAGKLTAQEGGGATPAGHGSTAARQDTDGDQGRAGGLLLGGRLVTPSQHGGISVNLEPGVPCQPSPLSDSLPMIAAVGIRTGNIG